MKRQKPGHLVVMNKALVKLMCKYCYYFALNDLEVKPLEPKPKHLLIKVWTQTNQ